MLVELRWLFWEVCFKAQKLIILTHKYYLYMWGDYNDITIFSLTEYKHITLTIKLGHIYDTIPACYIELVDVPRDAQFLLKYFKKKLSYI